MDEATLKASSRKDLQALAKSNGIKATLSSADIIEALLAKFVSEISNNKNDKNNKGGLEIAASLPSSASSASVPVETKEKLALPVKRNDSITAAASAISLVVAAIPNEISLPSTETVHKPAEQGVTAKAPTAASTGIEAVEKQQGMSNPLTTAVTSEKSDGAGVNMEVEGSVSIAPNSVFSNSIPSGEPSTTTASATANDSINVNTSDLSPSRGLKEKLIARKLLTKLTPKNTPKNDPTRSNQEDHFAENGVNLVMEVDMSIEADSKSKSNSNSSNSNSNSNISESLDSSTSNTNDVSPGAQKAALLKKLLGRKGKLTPAKISGSSMDTGTPSGSNDKHDNSNSSSSNNNSNNNGENGMPSSATTSIVCEELRVSRMVRIDHLQTPLIFDDFHRWLEATNNNYKINQRYIWMSPKKTHCYVHLKTIAIARTFKKRITGKFFDSYQKLPLVANYSSLIDFSEIATSEEAALPPGAWLILALANNKNNNSYNDNRRGDEDYDNYNDDDEEDTNKGDDDLWSSGKRKVTEVYTNINVKVTSTLPSIKWCPVSEDVVEQIRKKGKS